MVTTGTTYAGSFGSGSPVTVPGTTVVINEKLIVDVPWLLFQNQTLIMGPGAEIEVQSGNLLVMDNCTVYACDQMWLGVTMQQDANILILRSTVSDAHRTIRVGDRNKVVLIGSTFTDNFITVDAFSKSILNNGTVYYIAENIFEGTGSLKPKYPDQLLQLPELLPEITVSQFDDYPLAAIALAHSNIDFNTPYQGTGFNHFRNMSNGIINYKTKMNVEFCKFENIQPAGFYSGGTLSTNTVSFNGSAIFTFAHKSNAQLTQKGHFIGQTGVPSFIDCRYGIFADRCKVVSEHNIMQGMTNAYRVQLNKHDIFIRHNNIDSHRDAIQLLLNDGSPNVVVYDNDIVFGNSDAGQNYCGIRVNEVLTSAANSRINYNRINFRPGATAATTGIFTNATNGWIITNNDVEMDDNEYNLEGIFMAGCDFNIASCNFVEGSGYYHVDIPWHHQAAIVNLMGESPVIGCNFTDQTNNGIYVLGPVSGTSRIQGNDFNEHYFGLRYSLNAYTDNQYRLGNKWHQQAVNPGPPIGGGFGYMARHDNDLIDVQQDFHTANSTTSGPPWLLPHHAPTNWFKQEAGSNFNCEDTDIATPEPEAYCDEFPVDCPQCRTDMDIRIASDSISNDPYTDETLWMLQKSLYYKLDNNSSLLTDSLMNAFYYEMQSTSIPDFKMVDDGKKLLAQNDSLYLATMQYHSNQIKLNNDLALLQLDNFITGIESGSLNQSALSAIGTYQIGLSNWMQTGDSLVTITETNHISLINPVESSNSQVTATSVIEINEREVNSIYLATIAKGIYTYSPSQIIALTAIANQCPLSGGKAVFQARSLLTLTGQIIRYNDREICGAAGILIRQQQVSQIKSESGFKLYPNPANERVTIEYQFQDKGNYRLHLFNTLGKKEGEVSLDGLNGSTSFGTSHLPPGLYYYRVLSQSTNYNSGKFLIIR